MRAVPFFQLPLVWLAFGIRGFLLGLALMNEGTDGRSREILRQCRRGNKKGSVSRVPSRGWEKSALFPEFPAVARNSELQGGAVASSERRGDVGVEQRRLRQPATIESSSALSAGGRDLTRPPHPRWRRSATQRQRRYLVRAIARQRSRGRVEREAILALLGERKRPRNHVG